ncbi:MAG: endonuclease/exonuclease/phosphatase family protein, partial [Oscillospiraceae bacterium]|nr:endonuclease/exonuclease/phosphatase family protein [Oscillospiraceae bacterium]
MKRKLLCLLLLAAMIAVLLPTAKPQAKAGAQNMDASDVRIMSANVYAEFPTWWGSFHPEDTSARVVRLAKMLEENNPMAVCTQEMSPTWYTAFEQLDTTKWAWLTEPDAAGYSYYDFVPNVGLALNSILYRKDLLTLQGSGVEPYTVRTNGHCMVWGVFTVNSTGKQFVLISTHWTPDRPGDKSNERLAQAEQLAQKVNDLRLIYGDTVIVTGDFNCTDDSQEFRRFITNANAKDSRQWAARRGDHLSKIDHIVATADATVDYHTVCYESNNAYAISDHPFIVADIKLTSNLYFDFTDNADARYHYKQGIYRYNAYDYHTAYWKHDSNRVTGLTINKSDGTLSFNVTGTGNPYVFTDTKSATELKNAYGLNFPTNEAAHAFIRFRLTNCAQINTGTNPSLTLSALNRSTGQIKSEKKNFTLSQANAGYVTLHFPLSADGIRSLGNIDSIQLSFDNIKNGSVKIAYIYIGVDNYSPQNYSMMFDFSNTTGDQSRYKGSAYGGHQFDTASKGYWATYETSTTTGNVYNDFSIDNTVGTLSVKVAEGLSYNNSNGKYGPWFTTTKTHGGYPWTANPERHPLQYAPGNADFIQIRFKTEGCVLAAGSKPQIVVVYDYDKGDGTVARGAYDMVVNYTLKDGTYQIVSIPLSDQFKSAKKITTLGFRFWHIKGSSADAKVVIDYIFVGPEEAMPLHHVYDHKTVAATCTAKGSNTHTCRICGYSYTEYINATGHSYRYDYDKFPSSFGAGSLKGTCSHCSDTVMVEMPQLNTTDYTKTVVRAATCTEGGSDKYTWKVTAYGTRAINVSTPALGHDYVNYKATKNPTTTATGVLTGTCSRCAVTTTVTLPKLNTTDYTKTTTTAPTCTASGTDKYTWKTTTYGTFSFSATVNKLGHNYTGYKATTNPTTSATGVLTGTCSRCSGTT